MKTSVVKKQHNSAMCLVCGLRNELGLKASFFEVESGQVVALFTPRAQHQGYPGRLHGGLATAILDETIGRAVSIGKAGDVWGVTVELTVRFRKPVPLDQELRVVGRMVKEGGKIFEGSGEILLPDGQVAVSAHGRYMKLSIEAITGAGVSGVSDSGGSGSAGTPAVGAGAGAGAEHLAWEVVAAASDPAAIDLPG